MALVKVSLNPFRLLLFIANSERSSTNLSSWLQQCPTNRSSSVCNQASPDNAKVNSTYHSFFIYLKRQISHHCSYLCCTLAYSDCLHLVQSSDIHIQSGQLNSTFLVSGTTYTTKQKILSKDLQLSGSTMMERAAKQDIANFTTAPNSLCLCNKTCR